MKKLIPVLLLALAGVACDDLEGTIQVQSALTLKTKKETVTLEQGSHWAKLKLDEGDREIELKFKDAKGKEKKAIVKFPAGTVIPKFSGRFAINSSDSGQAFNLNGTLDTDVDEGPSINTTESCTYTREVRRWREIPIRDRDGRIIRWIRESSTEYITVNGLRDVRYHNKATTVTGNAEFIEPANGSQLANFSGSRSWSETIYEYQGRCF